MACLFSVCFCELDYTLSIDTLKEQSCICVFSIIFTLIFYTKVSQNILTVTTLVRII